MLDSILVNKEAVCELFYQNEDASFVKNILNDNDYNTIDNYCTLMQSVVDAIVYLSGKKYVTTSCMLPIFFSMIHNDLNELKINCEHILSLKEDLILNLKSRMNYIFTNDTYVASTFLCYTYRLMSL